MTYKTDYDKPRQEIREERNKLQQEMLSLEKKVQRNHHQLFLLDEENKKKNPCQKGDVFAQRKHYLARHHILRDQEIILQTKIDNLKEKEEEEEIQRLKFDLIELKIDLDEKMNDLFQHPNFNFFFFEALHQKGRVSKDLAEKLTARARQCDKQLETIKNALNGTPKREKEKRKQLLHERKIAFEKKRKALDYLSSL